jgi:hypothetical protein
MLVQFLFGCEGFAALLAFMFVHLRHNFHLLSIDVDCYDLLRLAYCPPPSLLKKEQSLCRRPGRKAWNLSCSIRVVEEREKRAKSFMVIIRRSKRSIVLSIACLVSLGFFCRRNATMKIVKSSLSSRSPFKPVLSQELSRVSLVYLLRLEDS